MSTPSEDQERLAKYQKEPLKITHYQTNKVPWYIHAMWMTFTLCMIIYLLRLAVPDFIRWW